MLGGFMIDWEAIRNMFNWLFKIDIKASEVPQIASKISEIYKQLSEAFVIGMFMSLKTFSEELKENTKFKTKTLYEIPDLEDACFGYQLTSTIFFLIKHIIPQDKKGVLILKQIKDEILNIKGGKSGKHVDYYLKYGVPELNRIKKTNLFKEDVSKLMKLPKIKEQKRLENAITTTCISMHNQVCLELATYFGKKRLANKYLYKAGKGILDDK